MLTNHKLNPTVVVEAILAGDYCLTAIAAQITDLLNKHQDKEYAKGSAIFVPDAPNIIGVRVPILQAMAKPLRKFAKSHPDKGAKLLLILWQKNTREHKLLAVLMMKGLATIAPQQAAEILEELLPNLTDWEVVDQLASSLSPLLYLDHSRWLQHGSQWLTSSQPWIRRLGMVIIVPLCRDKKVDLTKLAQHLEQARGETHPTQLKALGWCWREIGKKDPQIALEHLLIWATSVHSPDRRVAWSGSEKCLLEQRLQIRHVIDVTEKEFAKKKKKEG